MQDAACKIMDENESLTLFHASERDNAVNRWRVAPGILRGTDFGHFSASEGPLRGGQQLDRATWLRRC